MPLASADNEIPREFSSRRGRLLERSHRWLPRVRHRCARGARDGGDTMESGIAVHPLASTEPHSPLERPGVALETRDGGVVENLSTDSAVAKGGENHPQRVPESDSPDKPDTPPSRLSLDQLRAEIDAAVGSLPEILRVCTVDALTERVAPVFQDADHARCVKKPKNQSEWRERDEETRRGDATSSPRRRGSCSGSGGTTFRSRRTRPSSRG